MRRSAAIFLRKLADFLDPKVKPSSEAMTIRIEADASQAILTIEELTKKMQPLMELLNKAQGIDFRAEM